MCVKAFVTEQLRLKSSAYKIHMADIKQLNPLKKRLHRLFSRGFLCGLFDAELPVQLHRVIVHFRKIAQNFNMLEIPVVNNIDLTDHA